MNANAPDNVTPQGAVSDASAGAPRADPAPDSSVSSISQTLELARLAREKAEARQKAIPAPSEPFVGIRPYTRAQAAIFYERKDESRALLETVLTRRIVMLYGESGNGKSSLINAGLVPLLEQERFQLQPEVIRLANDLSEVVVGRRPLACDSDGKAGGYQSLFRPAVGARVDEKTGDFQLSVSALIEQLIAWMKAHPDRHVLLVFDQFEELHTFAGSRSAFSIMSGVEPLASGSLAQQKALASSLGELLRADMAWKRKDVSNTATAEVSETNAIGKPISKAAPLSPLLPVKFLFAFREEYLVKLQALVPDLLAAAPFRLAPIDPARLVKVIEGPFLGADEKLRRIASPFALSDQADFFIRKADKLRAGFEDRSGGLGQNVLTELQVVCLELWQQQLERERVSAAAASPKSGLMAAEINGVIERHFQRVLDKPGFPKALALDLLCEMVTADKTRNIVSDSSLREKLQLQPNSKKKENRYPAKDLNDILEALRSERFINQSERNGTVFYDLASEALIPWLSNSRAARLKQLERDRAKAEFTQEQTRKWLWIWNSIGLVALTLCALLVWQWLAARESNKNLNTANARLVEAVNTEDQLKKKAEAASLAATQSANAAIDALAKAKASAAAATESAKQMGLALEDAKTARQKAEEERKKAEEERQKALAALAELRVANESRDRAIAEQREINGKLSKKLAALGGDEAKSLKSTVDQLGAPLIARLAHTAPVNEAVFSPDGKVIASAGQDLYARVWDERGLAISSLKASSTRGGGGVRTLAFVPGTDLLLSGSGGQTVRLLRWKSDDKAGIKAGEVAQTPPLGDTVTHIEVSPTDPRQVVVSRIGKAQLFRLSASSDPTQWFKPEALLRTWAHTAGQPVSWASFSRDGRAVVTSSDDHMVRVFETANSFGPIDDPVNHNPNPVGAPSRRFVFSPVDNRFVAGAVGSKVLLWEVGRGYKAVELGSATQGHNSASGVVAVAFSPDGNRLASIGTDGQCFLWNTKDYSSVKVPVEFRGRLLGLDWKGDYLAIVGEDGGLEIWQASAAIPERKFATQAHTGVAGGVLFSPDGTRLLTWSGVPEADNVPSAAGAAKVGQRDLAKASDFTAALWNVDNAVRSPETRRILVVEPQSPTQSAKLAPVPLERINDGRTRAVPGLANVYVWVGRIHEKNTQQVDCRVFQSSTPPAEYYTQAAVAGELEKLKARDLTKPDKIGKGKPLEFNLGPRRFDLKVTELASGLFMNDHVDLLVVEK